MEILPQQFRTPEIYGDHWFNTDPIPLSTLQGYVVLIDFWDYTSLHCLRTLPYIKEWFKRYSDMGLVIIGVHTPQFPFARNIVNVRKAIEKLSLHYPIVVDNDYFIWNAFRCNTWPSKYLIDKNGFIRYIHPGGGQYQNFERAIQSLLSDAGYHDNMPLIMNPVRDTDKLGTICHKETPEILTGWQRGTIGNLEGYFPESTVNYKDPQIHITGRLYLHGDWFNERNYLKLNTENPDGGYLIFSYKAKEVYAVIKPEGEINFQIFVKQDDSFLLPANKGSDVRIDEQKRSFMVIEDAKLYNIVRNNDFSEHTLKISTQSNGFAIYSFSFETFSLSELTNNNS